MPQQFLSIAVIDKILHALPNLTIGVFGDLYLDRYLDLDASLTEPSLETGLDAYQVIRVRSYPGAAGTVINNLAALGVGRIVPFSVIGPDGEGFELRQALMSLPGVDLSCVFDWPTRRTPTYTKPMLGKPGEIPRELNRLDIHNRSVLPAEACTRLVEMLRDWWPKLHALSVLDQVSLPDCGVVTAGMRDHIAELAAADQGKPVLADSRMQIGLFRSVSVKPNEHECLRLAGQADLIDSARRLAIVSGKPLFCTRGDQGILLIESAEQEPTPIPAYPVNGPIDPVGAGDSTSAGILCARAAGCSLAEAGAFGNLIASITIQQLGTTGTATPNQVRARFAEINTRRASNG